MPGRVTDSRPARDARWVAAVLAVVAVLVVVVVSVSNTGPTRDVRGSRLSLEMRDYAFEPRNIHMASGPIEIGARNVGRNVHGLRVVSDDDKRGGRRSSFGAASGPVRPGETGELTVRCLGPGRYRIIGSLPGDEDLGMVADLRLTGTPPCRPARGS